MATRCIRCRKPSSKLVRSSGFCTPGFVLMTTQLLAAHPDPSEDQIRHYLSGNLCRCGTYPQIVEAVKLAARKLRIG